MKRKSKKWFLGKQVEIEKTLKRFGKVLKERGAEIFDELEVKHGNKPD